MKFIVTIYISFNMCPNLSLRGKMDSFLSLNTDHAPGGPPKYILIAVIQENVD